MTTTGKVTNDSPDVWSLIECGQLEADDGTNLDLMLPNGFLVSVRCQMDSTLSSLKAELFAQAKRFNFALVKFLNLNAISNIFLQTLSPRASKVIDYQIAGSRWVQDAIDTVHCGRLQK